MKRAWPLMLLGVAMVLGVLARLDTIHDVFSAPWPHAFSEDDHYHVRRVIFALRNPPLMLDFDRFMSFPHGAYSWWPNGFDRFLSLIVRIAAGADATTPEVTAITSLTIPFISICALPLVYLLGARLLESRPLGALAALIVAILPAHAFAGLAGVVDHHCTETLLSLLPILLLFHTLRSQTSPSPSRGQRPVPEPGSASSPPKSARGILLGAASGALLGSSLYVWSGAPLLYAVLFGALGLTLLGADRAAWRRLLPSLAAFAIALLAVTWHAVLQTPLGQKGEYVTFIISRFHLVWAAGLLGELALFALAGWFARGAPRHLLLFTAIQIVVVPAVAFAAGLRLSHLSDATAFVRSAGIVAWIEETAPIWTQWPEAMAYLSPLVFVLPPFVAWEAWRAFSRRADEPERALVHLCALMFMVLAFMQFRHKVHWVPFAALSMVGGGRLLYRALGKRFAHARWVPLLFVLASLGVFYKPLTWLRDVTLGRAGSAQVLDACDYIRTHSPRVAAYAPSTQPEWSVLGAWDVGKTIAGVCERPSLGSADAYGPQLEGVLDLMRFFTTRDPAEGARILDAYHVRYVLLPPQGIKHWEASIAMLGLDRKSLIAPSGLLTENAAASLYFRLYQFDGTAVGTGQTRLPALRELRLVHESRPELGASPAKVFERVAGVYLTAQLAPRSPALVEANITTDGNRRIAYRDFESADASGRLRIRFPYLGEVSVRTPGGRYRAHVRPSDTGEVVLSPAP
jgi:asparagine N-glycosylation enzyme membrane subunit Stt3